MPGAALGPPPELGIGEGEPQAVLSWTVLRLRPGAAHGAQPQHGPEKDSPPPSPQRLLHHQPPLQGCPGPAHPVNVTATTALLPRRPSCVGTHGLALRAGGRWACVLAPPGFF